MTQVSPLGKTVWIINAYMLSYENCFCNGYNLGWFIEWDIQLSKSQYIHKSPHIKRIHI